MANLGPIPGPAVLDVDPAADEYGLVVRVAGGISPESSTATWAADAQVAVTVAAGIVLAANTDRKWAAIQNVGDQPIRIGPVGLTNVLGLLILPKATLFINQPFVFTGAVYAIRDASATGDSTVSSQEGV